MNTNPGLIGTKLGNTQIFLDDGEVRCVTAIKAGPCVVVGKRTPDKDGYAALQLGFGSRRRRFGLGRYVVERGHGRRLRQG